jgi:uncharacterized protein (DUF1015 family)
VDPKWIRIFEETWAEHMPKAYIADGHHRCSTSASLYQSMKKNKKTAEHYRYLLCAFFPFDQLVIHEYNRVVDMPGDISLTVFMVKLSALCSIKHLRNAAKPRKTHELTIYLNREWYLLRWKKKVLKKYQDELVKLDTDILNKEVLKLSDH